MIRISGNDGIGLDRKVLRLKCSAHPLTCERWRWLCAERLHAACSGTPIGACQISRGYLGRWPLALLPTSASAGVDGATAHLRAAVPCLFTNTAT